MAQYDDASFPLSALQQGMLYHALAKPGSGVDIEQMVWDLPEAIDAPALRSAWEQVVARHDVLRVAFQWAGLPEPRQQVMQKAGLPWTELDWTKIDAAGQASALKDFLHKDRAKGFALDQAPLLRLTLIRRGQGGGEHWTLVWTFHHAILDGRSFPPLVQEVFARYEARRSGDTGENNPSTTTGPEAAKTSDRASQLSFREHVTRLQTLDHTASESFWREALRGFSAPTPLTVDRPQKASASVGHDALRLSSGQTTGLRGFAQSHGVSLGTLVQAAWSILLSRYSGQRDVVFGVTRAGRRSPPAGVAAEPGLFINTVPLRVQIDPERPLVDYLKEVRARWQALHDHEHTPLAQVQAWSEVPAGQPLFESLVVFENYQLQERLRALGGPWAARSFDLIEQTNFPLTLAACDGTELEVKLQFDPARFAAATAHRLLQHVLTLLTSMPAFASRKVRCLPLLPSGEQCELLVHSGTPVVEFPPDGTLVTWFDAQVAKTPERIAVTHHHQGARTELTYRELNARADRLARQLAARGIGPDALVGLFLERTTELIVGILGILKAGGAYVPMEASSPGERLAFMIKDAALPLIVTQRSLTGKLPGSAAAAVLCVEDLASDDTAALPPLNPARAPTAENLAYVIYTSGSTGRPKGTLVTHHNVVRLFRSTGRLFDFNHDDVWTLFHSAAFDFSVWEIWGALLHGGRLVVVPWLVSRSPAQFRALLAEERVTVLNQTPSAFRQLIHEDAASARDGLALRFVIFGGEALDLRSLAPWFERHDDQHPRLVNMYGITETTVHVTYRALSADDLDAGSVIGAPLPDLQLYLLDEDLRPVPIGVPGELFVGGDGLARGYLNRPELTEARFIPNPFSPGTRLYRTGDRARWLPDFDLEYLGRLDQQVKIRGFRIEPGEIEALLRRHPAVRDVVVLARDADGERRLVAYVVPVDATAPGVDFRAYLQPHLPEYMVPSAFVRLERLPLTEQGKLDHRALPAPEPSRPELTTPYVAPRTPAEKILATAWQAVLRVKQVGVDDNFFELGGNSLRLVQLLGRLSAAYAAVTLSLLFRFPTVRQLAAQLEQSGPSLSRLNSAQARAQRQRTALQLKCPAA
jgi:amino acid adenylation domain-containing protein